MQESSYIFSLLRCIDVYKAYLFGSSTKTSGNDIDILLISEDFEGMSRVKRLERLARNATLNRFDVVCMSKIEFYRLLKQKSAFLEDILSSAIPIYER
jgi:predicted nucleotidyltransferase